MKNNQFISMGFNEIQEDINICPRIDLPTGIGYEMCKEICKQENHAEINACIIAGAEAQGATLYLLGHTYCCNNCKKVMAEYGIKNIIIL